MKKEKQIKKNYNIIDRIYKMTMEII